MLRLIFIFYTECLVNSPILKNVTPIVEYVIFMFLFFFAFTLIPLQTLINLSTKTIS